MIAGLPGTGLGGIFYLIAAVWVIVREGVRIIGGASERAGWRALARLALMTTCILLVLWGTYWILGKVLGLPVETSGVSVEFANSTTSQTRVLPPIFVATLPIQLATIAALLASVEGLHWIVKHHSGAKTTLSEQPPKTDL